MMPWTPRAAPGRRAAAPLRAGLLLATALASGAATATAPAPAGWTQHASTPDSTIFVRKLPAAAAPAGVLVLVNYQEPTKYASFSAPALSSTMALHFDCAGRRWAVGDTLYFAAASAAGAEVFADRKQPAQLRWEPATRDSLGEEFGGVACGVSR